MRILDLDRVCLGDPALDLGKFLADLRWWSGDDQRAGQLTEAFRAGYGPPPTTAGPGRSCWRHSSRRSSRHAGAPCTTLRGSTRCRTRSPAPGPASRPKAVGMTPSPALDHRAATRLAGLDPALSSLSAALPHDHGAQSWLLHDARWTPGRALDSPTGSRRAAARPRSSTSASTRRAGPSTTTGRTTCCRACPPPRTPRPSPPGWVSHRRAGPALLGRTRQVPAGPAVRAALRGPHRDQGPDVLRQGVPSRRVRHGGTSRRGPRAGSRAARVWCPLTGVWPEAHTIVVGAVSGPSVSSVLRDPGVPAAEKAASLPVWGGCSHASTPRKAYPPPRGRPRTSSPRSRSPSRRRSGRTAGLATRLRALTDLLRGARPEGGVEVLAHGAFRAGQVVRAGDGRLVVLDVDGACRSDPGRDLGTALAHLVWQGLCLPRQQRVLTGAAPRCSRPMKGRPAPSPVPPLSWWRAAGLLQVAGRRFRRSRPGLEPGARPPRRGRRAPRGRRAAAPAQHGGGAPGPRSHVRGPVQCSRTPPPGPADALAVSRPGSSPAPPAAGPWCATRCQASMRRRQPGRGRERFVEPRRAELLTSTSCCCRRHLTAPPPRCPSRSPTSPSWGWSCAATARAPLSRVAGPERLREGVRGAARWLACLHSCEIVFPRSLSLDAEVASTRGWADRVGRLRTWLS